MIHGCLGVEGQGFQSIPDEDGARDMIPLNTTIPALTGSYSRFLFGLAMKLLHLPAQVNNVVHNLRDRGGSVVGDDIIDDRFRARGRPQQAE